MTQQWTKVELDDWCRGWCRTPHTTLKAFIDAGFCSDQEPSREQMRLLRQPTPSTVDATKPVMSADVWNVIQGLLKYCEPLGPIGDHFADKARALLPSRPAEPTDGKSVWYRGWECSYFDEGAAWGCVDAWVGYLGGADLDCIQASAATWDELLDEIDDHDMTEPALAALTEPTDG